MMGSSGDVEAGFAKLQGEDFEYYMQTYSIILGRNSKKSTVDVDLSTLGGGMNISRHHARIFYDFQRRRFALEVIGKNGCFVEGVLHLPGNSPVKLDSQDLLQIGDKKFYFLLPVRSILGGSLPLRRMPHRHLQATRIEPPPVFGSKKGHGKVSIDYLDHDDDEDDDDHGVVAGPSKKFRRSGERQEGSGYGAVLAGKAGLSGKLVTGQGFIEDDSSSHQLDLLERGIGAITYKERDIFHRTLPWLWNTPMWHQVGLDSYLVEVEQIVRAEKKAETRSRIDRDADNHQLLQLEEKDVVSSVATVLSDLCGPGEWMPMKDLHSELVEQYGSIWHHSRVRRYLRSEDWPVSESNGKP
ncbi:hypothetical protein HHK36_020240 [Tetracentron sinense]|uniref:FHA domain-containing protein n=1 Tax=Tetracentron sinense TaxID=13715 RepID=A0A835D7V0_TETSI|nr:hypothetical protein HHK36_020240 [Tetracentron sinense]